MVCKCKLFEMVQLFQLQMVTWRKLEKPILRMRLPTGIAPHPGCPPGSSPGSSNFRESSWNGSQLESEK